MKQSSTLPLLIPNSVLDYTIHPVHNHKEIDDNVNAITNFYNFSDNHISSTAFTHSKHANTVPPKNASDYQTDMSNDGTSPFSRVFSSNEQTFQSNDSRLEISPMATSSVLTDHNADTMHIKHDNQNQYFSLLHNMQSEIDNNKNVKHDLQNPTTIDVSIDDILGWLREPVT